jgi:hypothetical protein
MLQVRNAYRPMKNPAHAGQVRSKTWAMHVFLTENDYQSPLWQKRLREYWERQGQLYGLEMSDFTASIEPPDPATGKPAFITTWSVVKAVLPGERLPSMGGTQ